MSHVCFIPWYNYNLHVNLGPIFSNLDETTRSVYKENVRLNAALDFHLKEGQDLKKVSLMWF